MLIKQSFRGRVDLGGLSQTLYHSPVSGYNNIHWTNVMCDEGGFFDTTYKVIRPPYGSRLKVGIGTWVSANHAPPTLVPGSGFDCCLKMIVNDTLGTTPTRDLAVPGWVPAGFPGTAGATITFEDDVGHTPTFTDFYTAKLYVTSVNAANDVLLDGNPAHTWMWWEVQTCS